MTPAQRNAKKAMKLHHEEGYSLKEAWRMVRGGKSNPRKRKIPRQTVNFKYKGKGYKFSFTPKESDWWTTFPSKIKGIEFDVHYDEDYGNVSVYEVITGKFPNRYGYSAVTLYNKPIGGKKSNPRKRKNSLSYTPKWYVFSKSLNKPISRWEYKEDAQDDKDERVDFDGVPKSDLLILSKKAVQKRIGSARLVTGKVLNEYLNSFPFRNNSRQRKRKNFHHNPKRRSNGRYMSKAAFDAMFKEEYIPMILRTEMSQGSRYPDRPMRREAYNNAIDSLAKDGQISEDQAFRWSHPAWLETYGFRKALAEQKKRDRYGYSNPRKRKNGTKKGQARKTARRAYMKNGKSAAQKRAQANAKKAMNLYKSGKARSLKAAWRMVKRS